MNLATVVRCDTIRIMSATITILHQTDRSSMFAPFDVDTAHLVEAYSYSPDRYVDTGSNDELENIYRENNAVQGWEENVKAQARSLSVGDVVKITGDDLLERYGTYYAVDTFGFKLLLEADVLIGIERGRS